MTEAYLPGVARCDVRATVGPVTSFPQQRMRKSFGLGHMPDMVHCPARCHNGGFDLARDILDKAIRRRAPHHTGSVKCRGYVDLGHHRRQACNYTMEYEADIEYGAGGMDL